MRTTSSTRFLLCISLASVWFGTHVGGGFAMGQNTLQFFTRFGWTALIFPLLAMTIDGVSFYYAWNFARLTKTYDYKGYLNKFYHPYEKSIGSILDISFLIILCLPVGASIAGGGALLNSVFGLPVILGNIFTATIFLIMACFGVGFINKMSFGLTILIVISLGTIAIIGISQRYDAIVTIVTSRELAPGSSYLGALWAAILYASFQSTNAPMIAASEGIKTKKEVLWTTIIGIIINGTVLTLISVVALGWFPEIINEKLPNVRIAQDLGYPWLYAFYCIALYAAYITTAVTFLFAVGKRFSNSSLFKNVKPDSIFAKKPQMKANIVIFFAIIYSLLASAIGVVALVKYGFKYVGYLYIPLVLLPQLIVGPIKCRKLEKEAGER